MEALAQYLLFRGVYPFPLSSIHAFIHLFILSILMAIR